MRSSIIVAPLCLCLLAISGVSAQQTAARPLENTSTGMTDKGERYRIGFQDVLDVQVFRHTDLSQKVAVSQSGTITLFRLDHPVTAVCKTERELATDIANAYKEKYLRDPEVSVVVSEQHSQSIAVIGAVEHPGSFFVNRKYQLLEMLALAGGPNKDAGTRLIVARAGSTSNCHDHADDPDNGQVLVSDFKIRDLQEGKATFWMKPGDVVSVLDADVVYMYGDVNRQGPVRVREPITLTQAIASAEGLRPTAKKGVIRVLRQRVSGGDRQELAYDLNLIDKGKVKDPYLESGDIVAVSQDQTKKILQGITSTIKSTVPSAIYRIP